MDFQTEKIKIRHPAGCLFLWENRKKSEILLILRTFLKIQKIPAILSPSGPALPILPFLSFFPETVLFFPAYFLSFSKNFFPSVFFEKILIFRKFSLSPSFRPFFSPCGKFSRFFCPVFSRFRKFIFFLCLLPFSEHFLFRKCKNTADKTADGQFFRLPKSERFSLIKRIFSFLFPVVFPTVVSVFSCCPVKLF